MQFSFGLAGVLLFIILAGLTKLGLGWAVGARLPERSTRRREEELARERLLHLQGLSSRVTDQVARHSDCLAEVRHELAAAESGGGAISLESVAAAAARLLEANRQLESELGDARREMATMTESLQSQTHAARTDGLTGLFNRRAFDEEMERRFAQWRRQHIPLAIMMVDVDHFKRVNDQHGHPGGDEVLRRVAAVLQKTMRDMDVVVRYGGEEFAAIMPGTSLNDSQRAGERVRSAVEAAVTSVPGGVDVRVTVSVGLAQALPGDDPASLVARADAALYAAKQAGRNRVFCHLGGACRPAVADPAPRLPVENALDAIETQILAVRQPLCSPASADRTADEDQTDDERRKHERRSFLATQSLAPCIDGEKPSPAMFREVQCEDLLPSGFSFMLDAPPAWDTVVVEFGVPPNLMYLSACIAHSTPCQSWGATRYKVGCRFTGRMQL